MANSQDRGVETADAQPCVGIVCGGGALPAAVAASPVRRGRPVFLLAIEGWAEPKAVAGYEHCWVALGQFGRAVRLARAAGCRDIAFIGSVLRPALWSLRLDFAAVRLLPRLIPLFRGGDDRLLAGIGRIFEEHGFRLVGAHEIAPEILVPEGALGRLRPSMRDLDDAARGLALIEAMGPYDVGQAVVVADGHVLAVEAAEGTDQILERIKDLRAIGRISSPPRSGVLVKAPKPQQDRRLDLPSIGPATIAAVSRAGLAGIVVAAGEVVIAEPEEVARKADAAALFVAGVLPARNARA
jgi:DUF1009 family protein